ncbi:MAG: FAD-binding oxidoreductase [Chloroherpetonaceae bacterium]|nr:FAD-binding oxidoreductase [Chloroherpetonaceae bacterium]MDW8438019.1 FAD-binding oxidoreductase [Chloroherpetonaceae bacterium]
MPIELSGWGRFPVVQATPFVLKDSRSLSDKITRQFRGVAYAMGRSYGDSALASEVILTSDYDHFLDFDATRGLLRVQAGVTLKAMLDVIVPKGWFLPVTPGTQFVTFGGAIASDIHGKNHHKEGSFCDHVTWYRLMLPNGDIVRCSPTENVDLFRATNGGMGLTGVILDGELRLKPIQSAFIEMLTIKAKDLDEILALFDDYVGYTYSVAWIDTLARGKNVGRSVLMLGEHGAEGSLSLPEPKEKSLPIDFPDFVLNPLSVGLFNALYYHKNFRKQTRSRVPYRPFFYPLDAILRWNKMYGKRGFTQYQFVIPKSERESLKKILEEIAKAKLASFLAVLKLFGKENENWLSFPKEGYTLALDFPMRDGTLDLLKRLDKLVLDAGGRLYLTKDAQMSKETFRAGYPNWERFVELRRSIGADKVFASLQSERLGL